MKLDGVEVWSIPEALVNETEMALRDAGEDGHELFVLWSGSPAGRSFDVRHVHIPRQTAYRSALGLAVRVGGQALHDLNVWLYAHDEILGAQVHGHPDDAYHSDTDDAFPIVSALGSLSIVVSRFGVDGIASPTTACYRLGPSGFGRRIAAESAIVVV